jgi:hypothetical protein
MPNDTEPRSGRFLTKSYLKRLAAVAGLAVVAGAAVGVAAGASVS